jgi:rhodanese-related sulfurtransferase
MSQFMQFVANHWVLWLALVVVLIAVFIYEVKAQQQQGAGVSPQGAVGLINHESAIVIDVRNQDAFRQGHIIDSISSSANLLEDKKMNKYKSKSVILVCANGTHSGQLAPKLKGDGFTHVTVLRGGINAWKEAQLPLVKGK